MIEKNIQYQSYYGKIFEIVKFDERKLQLWVWVLHSQSILPVEHNLNEVTIHGAMERRHMKIHDTSSHLQSLSTYFTI